MQKWEKSRILKSEFHLLYQAAGAERQVGAVSMERRVAGEIPSVVHPGLSNHLPAALPYSIHTRAQRDMRIINDQEQNVCHTETECIQILIKQLIKP